MALEYKSRSVRLDDQCWEALRQNPLSANRLLRIVLGLDNEDYDPPPAAGPEVGSERGKATVPTRRVSKKQEIVEELKASDLTAQMVGREDIEYGTHEQLPKGEHVANMGAGPTVGVPGKAALEDWRSKRQPLPKPGDK